MSLLGINLLEKRLDYPPYMERIISIDVVKSDDGKVEKECLLIIKKRLREIFKKQGVCFGMSLLSQPVPGVSRIEMAFVLDNICKPFSIDREGLESLANRMISELTLANILSDAKKESPS